jgi:signal transduction histidine kinase/CheY-like chemotaxis protein
MRSTLRELRGEIVPWLLPVFWLASLFLLGTAARYPEPFEVILVCLATIVTGSAVLALHRVSYAASAWALVLGSAAIVLLVATQMRIPSVLCLLMVPVGLAGLLVSLLASVSGAMACTVLLWAMPPSLTPVSPELCWVSTVAIWSTAGLIWLAQQPLLTTLQWSWSSTDYSLRLLEQARDQRVELKQALEDLANANLQLARLNNLAQSLRKAAEDARRVKEQFVANVSHELRTPLNMIIGFSETILQAPEIYGDRIPPAVLADLQVILRNSQHLSDLIDDVLDLSRMEAGQMVLSRGPVALDEIIEAATVAVQPLFASKGLYLQTEIAANLPEIYGDATRIREVLLNLLSNAGRFTERGGVHVRAWQEGDDVVVSVADTGPGIADNDRERLFRRFEQLDGSLRRRCDGTGLGLAISKSFVELHGGQMWLESQVGVGTTFFFRLPVGPPAPAQDAGVQQWLRPEWEYEQRPRPRRLPVPTVRPRLVVLEAGDSLQRWLARYAAEVEVVPVTSLAEAAAELARTPAQALLINQSPVSEALQRLTTDERLPDDTPVIICAVPGAHEAAAALGATDYLVKPVRRDTLRAALERLQLEDGDTLLVVDDDVETTRLFRRMLNSLGRNYRVLTTSEGRQALQILRSERPAALLLDLVMPDMDGFQLLSEKNSDAALRPIPTVIISAQDAAGQPVVTNAVAITRSSGLAMPQLLACIEVFSGPLRFPPTGRGSPRASPG